MVCVIVTSSYQAWIMQFGCQKWPVAKTWVFFVAAVERIYYTSSKVRLTENIFPLTPTLVLFLNYVNVFGLTKW